MEKVVLEVYCYQSYKLCIILPSRSFETQLILCILSVLIWLSLKKNINPHENHLMWVVSTKTFCNFGICSFSVKILLEMTIGIFISLVR